MILKTFECGTNEMKHKFLKMKNALSNLVNLLMKQIKKKRKKEKRKLMDTVQIHKTPTSKNC